MKLNVRRGRRLLAGSCVGLFLAASPALASPPSGPDVASYQHPSGASIDWNRVAASGAPFAFVKATEDTNYTNPYFVADWKGIAAAGMVRGTYHYARPSLPLSSAVDQANAFINFTGTTVEAGDLPPVLDMEEAGGLGSGDLIAWTHTFLDTVQQRTGRLAIIYTYPNFWLNAMSNSTEFSRYPLWIADYNGGSAPTTPLVGGWTSWTFWQYTSSSNVDGISGAVDSSIFCCDSAALANMSYGGAPGTTSTPPPSASAPTVPGAPTSVRASVGNGAAMVSWTAPSAPGSDPVSSYQVTPSSGGTEQAAQVFPGTGTSQQLSGLRNGVQYTFTVTARNKAGSGAASAPSNAVTPVAPPLTSASDPTGTVPSRGNPLVVSVLDPAGNHVTITKGKPSAASGYAQASLGAALAAPPSSTKTATTTLAVHASALPSGTLPQDITVLRNGAELPPCTGAGPPCLSKSTFDGSVLSVTVSSIPTGAFSVAADRAGRIRGADRIATAIASSNGSFPTGGAGAVVLARSDTYADALAGTPLAAAQRAPLLLTPSAALDSRTAREIDRVLPAGGTVYLLGGLSALSQDVADALTAKGVKVVRYAGNDRYGTAVAIAAGLGSPATVFLATGTNFPDGLSAGAAAGHLGAAVLLTDGASLPPATLAYLKAHPGRRYAVGGLAAQADTVATPLVGADRYDTAVKVARAVFSAPGTAGIASGQNFPDALSAGPALATAGAPLLLADPTFVPAVVATYLAEVAGTANVVHLQGGDTALSAAVQTAVRHALG